MKKQFEMFFLSICCFQKILLILSIIHCHHLISVVNILHVLCTEGGRMLYCFCQFCIFGMLCVDSLYSCLANGSADEFQKGEQLFKSKSVSNALQIGKYINDNFGCYF